MGTKFKASTKKQIESIIINLKQAYPNAVCGLDYNSPLMLTVGLILAAQCTDNMVNRITPKLFKKYPSQEELAKAEYTDVEEIVKPCGFYKNKAKNIVDTANILVSNYGSEFPNTMKDLTSLRGIGRKSANIVLQECFGKVEGIAVDTHVKRLTYRMGITNKNTQDKIEQDLLQKIDRKYWNVVNHVFVVHGRAICTARKPMCDECPIKDICPKNVRSIQN